jgi:hypothetical protein
MVSTNCSPGPEHHLDVIGCWTPLAVFVPNSNYTNNRDVFLLCNLGAWLHDYQ